MKLLFTDLDGTLLNDDKTISKENLAAIERAAKKGNPTIITTGRSLSSASVFIDRISAVSPVCYAVLYNGGLIYDVHNRTAIYKKTIPLPYVRYIFEQAEKFRITCQTYENDYVITPRSTPEITQYKEHSKMNVHIDPDLLKHLQTEPFKVLTLDLFDRKNHEAYRKSLKEWAAGKISLFFSNEYYLEHVPFGVSKGNAIRILSEFLRVPLSDTLAAGDAENDITMLKAAGTGICMKNGNEQIKHFADYITIRDNNHGGIAEIIEKFMEN